MTNHDSVPAMDFNHVLIHSYRGYGKRSIMEAWEEIGLASQSFVEGVNRTLEPLRDRFSLEPPPTVMERALAARQTRNTGPIRPSAQHARRPRRHQ